MISVVGAGPVGCIAAIACLKHNQDVVIYESQKTETRRIQCSGLLSHTGLKSIGINPHTRSSEEFIQHSVRGARIYSPNGFLLTVDGGKDRAFVVDRRKFDNHLLQKAVDLGAVYVNKKIDKTNIHHIINKSDKVIIATGTNYNLHRILNLDKPKKFIYGAQYELHLEHDPEYVELFLNVPGFFSWIIPAGDLCRVGLCAETNPTPFLNNFVKKLKAEGRIKDDRVYGEVYGIIPIYNPHMRAQYDKINVVGDAAGHVKATTGGGIILGGQAASYAYSKDYEKKWRKEVGKELYIHLKIRQLLNKLSDENLDKLIKTLTENKKIIEEEGDMDKASNLLKHLLTNPKFTAKILTQTPNLIKDILFYNRKKAKLY